jgi:hypothetical protein
MSGAPLIPRPRISPPSREELLDAECTRLREVMCRIVIARDEGDFDAMMQAITEGQTETILSALRKAGER